MNKRQYLILDYLLEQTDYVSGKQIASQLGVSTKTIYADIRCLQEVLEKLQVEIDVAPRRGVRLIYQQDQYQEIRHLIQRGYEHKKVEAYSPEDREHQLVKHLMLFGQPLVIEDQADDFFVSIATLQRDIHHLASRLQDFGLSLCRSEGQMRIEGQEVNVRKCLRYYLQEWVIQSGNTIEALSEVFPIQEIRTCQQAIEQLSETYQHPFTEEYTLILMLDCLIALYRYQRDHIIVERSRSLVHDLSHLEVYFFAAELLEIITGQALPDLPALEIETLAYSLLAVGFKVQLPDYERTIQEQVDQLVSRLSELLELDLSQDAHFMTMLTRHLVAMVFRLRNGMRIMNPALEEIRRQYLPLMNIVWLAMREFTEFFEISLPDNELAFLVIHCQIAVDKVQQPLTIAVVCQHGLATSELILNRLKRVFSPTDRVLQMKWSEIEGVEAQSIDLIVSSLDIPPSVTIPAIRVSPIMTRTELDHIRQHYDQLSSSHRQVLKHFHQDRQFQLKCLSDLIQVSDHIQEDIPNQEEALRCIIEASSQQNLINPRFSQSVYNREAMGSTSVYTGVALPHSDPKEVRHSEVVVMTLKKPIQWGNNQVQMIMLVAIAERDVALFKEGLVALYSLIEDSEVIGRMCHCTQATQLKACLIEEVSRNVR